MTNRRLPAVDLGWIRSQLNNPEGCLSEDEIRSLADDAEATRRERDEAGFRHLQIAGKCSRLRAENNQLKQELAKLRRKNGDG